MLVQLCAPRESIKHFLKMQKEQLNLQLNQALSQHRPEPFPQTEDALYFSAFYTCMGNTMQSMQFIPDEDEMIEGLSHSVESEKSEEFVFFADSMPEEQL